MKIRGSFLCNNILITLLLSLVLHAEEVCKVAYNGQPENLDGRTITLPHGTVAMSEEIQVGIPEELVPGGVDANPSIMFVLDHSGSMWYPTYEMDVPANRFKVTSALIDSIYDRNPNAEVGLSIFARDPYLNTTHDSLLKRISSTYDEFGYMPLLTLDSTYDSEYAGKKSGKDILKEYLLVKDTVADTLDLGDRGVFYNWPFETLRYSSKARGGTNINAGFAGAKAAFKDAKNGKGRHYIIFISDGDNGYGGDGFTEGTNVPSTFTIFFADSGKDVPTSIKTMTGKINTNNYSENKVESEYWGYRNTTPEKLMGFVMENIIAKIDQKIKADVTEITVNEKTLTHGWNGTHVLYNEMFPLEGNTTNFTYNINYYIEDTVTIDGVVEISTSETPLETKFTVELNDGVTVPDSFSTTCWSRKLSFVEGSTELSTIGVNNSPVIRFMEEAIDNGYYYNYRDVDIELVSLGKEDTLTLRLNRNNNVHTYGLDIVYDQDKDLTDRRLQVEMTDTIVAIFRNPKLPLDTLRDTIPYDVGTLLSLKSGTYFDNNADGYIDSIFVTFGRDSELSKEEMTELLALMQFPTERSFIVDYNGVAWSNGGMAIPVAENSKDPRTSIHGFDTLSLKENELSNGGLTFQSMVTFTDSVAPIIMKEGVSFDDKPGSGDDRLIVLFSEEIKNEGKSGDYFTFTQSGTSYSAKLNLENVSGNSATFTIGTIQGVDFIADGDSLQIHTTSNLVKDLVDVTQNNDNNPWRRISVRSTIALSNAVFYDANADGRVDSITIDVDAGEGANLDAMDLANKVMLPSMRTITKDSAWFDGNTLVMQVQELAPEINTAVGSGDTVVILAGQSGTSVITSNITLSAIDSMAPVIKSDVLLRDLPGTGVDTLTVEFSEEIKEKGTGRYFSFWNSSTSYSADIQIHSVDGNKVTFLVNSISGTDAIRTGDSLRISGDFNLVSDKGHVTQRNNSNIGREIQVITTVSVSDAAYFDTSGDGFIDMITVNVDAGDGVTLEAMPLAGQISLPAIRALTLDSASLIDKKLSLFVKEGNAIPNTAVSSDDKIILRAGRVGGAEISEDITVSVADSMAPVLLDSSAILFDYPGSAKDTLLVVFSEPVSERVQSGKYFNFRSGADGYDVFLEPASTEGATVRYKVELTLQPMKNGDWLRINTTQPMIMDQQTIPNVQRNENNTEVPLQVIAAIEVGEASYYDENADGFIDLVTINVAAGEGVVLTGSDLMPLIHLPSYRRFITNDVTIESGVLSIGVVEDRAVPNTAVTNSDSITIEKGAVKGAIIPETRTIGVLDRVAPVILEDGAILMDYAEGTKDSMVVRFSEPVLPMTFGGEQFKVRRGTENYHLFLTPVDQVEEEVLYVVENVVPFPYVGTGDSIRIDADLGFVRDAANNIQKNSTNIERRIRVFADIEATDATYFDRNADGMIDSIRIGLIAGNSLYDNSSDFLVETIELPEERQFVVDSSTFEGTSLVLYVTEGTEYPVTNIQSYDEIIINDLNSEIGIIESSTTLSIADSVAPVIVPEGAILHDSLAGTDLLEVTLSEPVTISAEQGELFSFVDGLVEYEMVVKQMAADSITVLFEVISSTREEYQVGSDSIWINSVLPVIIDAEQNVQLNSDNIKRSLIVQTYINPYELDVKAVTPYVQGVTVVPTELADLEFDLELSESGQYTGLIIQAKAKLKGEENALQGMNLDGTVTIVDVVGNVVATSKEMIYIPEFESIFFVWNCRNENGRPVGLGTYMASVAVRASTVDGSYSKEFRKVMTLGIKRPL